MSSIRKTYAQIPSNVKYFLTTDSGSYAYYSRTSMEDRLAAVASVDFTFDGTNVVTNTVADMITLYQIVYDIDYMEPANNTLMKDLGRVIEFKIGGLLAVRWNLIQFVNGATTEGVPVNYPTTGEAWIPTYVADQAVYDEPVVVARIG